MSYLLSGSTIRRPQSINVTEDVQVAQVRTLNGNINRDYFGSSKRVWTLRYSNTNSSDYSVIKTIYDSYISTGSTKTWEITETNYTVSQVNVHIDLKVRDFRVKGTDYLSDFTLILTEA